MAARGARTKGTPTEERSFSKELTRVRARLDQMDERDQAKSERLDRMDARFDGIDARFDQVDSRFAQIDSRFAQIDARFDRMDVRFDQMEERERASSVRLEEMDQRTRGMMVLLERMDERNRATIEAVFSIRDQMNRRIDDLRAELTGRIDVLEMAVRDLSAQVKKNSEDIQNNTIAIGALEEQVKEVKGLLERKADEASLLALEKRVSVLEEKLGVKSSN